MRGGGRSREGREREGREGGGRGEREVLTTKPNYYPPVQGWHTITHPHPPLQTYHLAHQNQAVGVAVGIGFMSALSLILL